MIPRYTRPEMAEVWSEENKLKRWLEVEIAVTEHWAKAGLLTKPEWKKFETRGNALLKKGLSVSAIAKLDEELRHDVLAFTTYTSSKLGKEGRFLHYGMTSTDVVDTALSLTIQKAGELVLKDIEALRKVLKKRALKHKQLPTIGRTHGMSAEPTSFGLKFLGFYEELGRAEVRLKRALEEMRFGKLSGAVGANAHLSVKAEIEILKRLGLKREPVSTQVLPRDRFAELVAGLGILGSSLERFAVELRHLQRSEVAEVREEFSKKQKGSSAMPHKRNPISSENITGVARLLRAYVMPSMENIALWHERDISHSSTERVMLPDAFILIDYALVRFARVIDALFVDEIRVQQNLTNAGRIVYAGHLLLLLVQKGANREEAYRWIQKSTHASIDEKRDFLDVLDENKSIRKFIGSDELHRVFDPTYALRGVDGIYKQVLGSRN